MMTLIKQYLNFIIAGVIISATLFASSYYYNNKIYKINAEYTEYRLTTEKNIEAQKVSILSQQNILKEENLKLINKLKGVENENYKNYTALQKANANIKSNVSNGDKRLYINASCPSTANNSSAKAGDTTAPRLDDGKTSKSVIDSRDATAIISITEKADKYKSQLEALQNWIIELK